MTQDALERLHAAGQSIGSTTSTGQCFTTDVRDARDLFRPVHERPAGGDGYVSIEVSPDLPYKPEASMAEATRLWTEVYRPNAMITIPGTMQALLAIRELTAARINVNITLLFSREMHEKSSMRTCPDWKIVTPPEDPSSIQSVGSFFVSRVDANTADAEAALKRIERGDFRARRGSQASRGRNRQLRGVVHRGTQRPQTKGRGARRRSGRRSSVPHRLNCAGR